MILRAIRLLIGWGVPPGAARAIAIAVPLLALAALTFVGVRHCQHRTDMLIATSTKAGAGAERAAGNERTISNAEKVGKADAATRERSVDERMRDDPNCRDCQDR